MNTKEIIAWFEIKYPESLIFTTGYGIFIPEPRLGMSGLWIEEHTGPKEQSFRIESMSKMGYEAIWAAGSDVAIAAIEVYMFERPNVNY